MKFKLKNTGTLLEDWGWTEKDSTPVMLERPSTPLISSSRASSSSGLSGVALSPGNAECSNCKLLTMKIKILEARLAMKRHPDDYACQSAAILHELLNEMENLRVE
ncbi:hypothetical protein Tco_1401910 [Tanacetum coccineum]